MFLSSKKKSSSKIHNAHSTKLFVTFISQMHTGLLHGLCLASMPDCIPGIDAVRGTPIVKCKVHDMNRINIIKYVRVNTCASSKCFMKEERCAWENISQCA